MEELFNGQLSFADIDAEKFLHVRRAHADRRVNAMDRLTDDVINELIQLCLPHYHIKAGETVQQGRLPQPFLLLLGMSVKRSFVVVSDDLKGRAFRGRRTAHGRCKEAGTLGSLSKCP
ncbi:MAG: hypothetical protein V8T25_01270 [Sutterella wadsworthensis]